MIKRISIILLLSCIGYSAWCWGFYAHSKVNTYAVYLLPPEMMVFYKKNILFLSAHATDADKRRSKIPSEGAKHYIDIDRYGAYPYEALPRRWEDAVSKYSHDSIIANGIVPWNILSVLNRLTAAFKEKDFTKILKTSADIGHYIADAHVPLHTNSNHNGQLTGQKGIHAFWESRIPELLADKEFDFFIGKAQYISNPADYIWHRILESGIAADSVLQIEKQLSAEYPADKKYAFEQRGKLLLKQYSEGYTVEYNRRLNGMVARRMRQAIFSISSFWYTAWVNAGQPDLESLLIKRFTPAELKQLNDLQRSWKSGKLVSRDEE